MILKGIYAIILCFFLGLIGDISAEAITDLKPEVETLSAISVVPGMMTLNGRANPRGLSTTYYFEYGTTASYGFITKTRSLPSKLAAYYYTSWDNGPEGWRTRLNTTHFDKGGYRYGYMRFSEPSISDGNHREGVGQLHLVNWLFCGSVASEKSVLLGGGDPDLRGAKISVSIRGNDFQPNGSELIWWSQAQSNIELLQEPGWRRSNWGYIAFPLTDYLLDGEWHKLEFELLNDASKWIYGDRNNKQGSFGRRYKYWPIDKVLAHHNYDFFFVLAFIDTDNPPTGSIDFDEIEICYRNKSLVFPANGGRLISWPRDSSDSPASLTDGRRHGRGYMWQSAENQTYPLEFVYFFNNPVVIETVQLHQNTDYPTKDVEVFTSMDGVSYRSLLKEVMPVREPGYENFAFLLVTGMSAKARYLKVQLKSGYKEGRCGLGEIEVFGQGAVMLPDDDIYYVNTDLHKLIPGRVYHYRIVATNSYGRSYGQDRTFITENRRYSIWGWKEAQIKKLCDLHYILSSAKRRIINRFKKIIKKNKKNEVA